jgi:hypothetical protein
MAIKTKLNARASLAPLLSLAMLFTIATAASGQTMQPAPAPDRPAPLPAQRDDITRQEVADMNQFLENHPEIAEQLRKDPSLIDNRRWVADHPALQEYLQNHPRTSEAFHTNPNLFMRDEDRNARQTDDINRRDLVDMHEFLNRHPEIAEQLRKDPSLIDNRRWDADHPALQEFLQTHPQVSDTFRAHPDAFMRDEERDSQLEGYRDHDGRMGADDRNRGELTSFGQFLGGHANVAADLSRDPSLANNREYLSSHPELDEYLKAHPTMSQQLAENPQEVMGSASVQESGGFNAKPVGPTPKPKSTPNQ